LKKEVKKGVGHGHNTSEHATKVITMTLHMPDAGRDCVRSDPAIAGYLLPAQATADMMMSRSPILLEKTGCFKACTVLACKKTQLDTSQTVCHP
jgi:hypothetical protein